MGGKKSCDRDSICLLSMLEMGVWTCEAKEGKSASYVMITAPKLSKKRTIGDDGLDWNLYKNWRTWSLFLRMRRDTERRRTAGHYSPKLGGIRISLKPASFRAIDRTQVVSHAMMGDVIPVGTSCCMCAVRRWRCNAMALRSWYGGIAVWGPHRSLFCIEIICTNLKNTEPAD